MSINAKIIAEDTLRILNSGFYINGKNEKVDISGSLKFSTDNTKLYTPEELDTLNKSIEPEKKFTTRFSVSNETTMDAARRLIGTDGLMVLNFASAKNEGGGFIRGAIAQEETIARASGLYPTLLKCPQYYSYHRTHRTLLYSDHMIWSPAVVAFKFEDGSLMDQPVHFNVITSAAVNAGELRNNESDKENLIEPVMRKRIEKMLTLAYSQNQQTLILGAWGCGVFRNDPDMIAALFHEALQNKFKDCFQHVAFIIKTSNEAMLDSFRKPFINEIL